MSASKHSVFVLDCHGKPLMPTTPCRARKLMQAGMAKGIWSKFNTFGIQMLGTTRRETQPCSMGIDAGTKFEGYSVVAGEENVINIKLDLPDKKKIVSKLQERCTLRRSRRSRKCRRRKARFDNRRRKSTWLAPSQRVVVESRLKVIRALASMYPITKAGLEDVCFNHRDNRWGKNFSTVEIGKNLIRQTFSGLWITFHEFKGWETKEFRERYGYKKCSDKAADRFESHCCDSLALACRVQEDKPVEPCGILVVDDTYRCVRRRLHDTQPARGGVRADYSQGTVLGLRKGLKVGYKSQVLRLTGINKGKYRLSGKNRPCVSKLAFVSSQYITRKEANKRIAKPNATASVSQQEDNSSAA